jgi:myo-inositol 2-dehydrogenase / D-chiro-inositol 1-dehydrogenase
LKVLVIGSGRMGAIRTEDLVQNPKLTKLLITNRNEESGKALATKFGAEFVPWSSYQEASFDAAIVAVGTDAHEQVLSQVLPKSIPVLCEKPISATVSGTREVIAQSEKYNSPLQIGFQRRFDEPIKKMQQIIASGEIGTLYSLAMRAHDHTPSPKEFIAGSGGIFRDMHVHDFDLVRWLTGSEVDNVYATKAVRHNFDYAEFDDADVSSVSLVTQSGVQVTITGTRHDALGHDIRLEAFGSNDSISAGLNQRTPLRDLEGELALNKNPYQGFVDRFRDAFKNETNAFVQFALGEIANPCPPDSALESLRIAIACEKSISTGAAVKLAEVSH